jgi:hypothetical protein
MIQEKCAITCRTAPSFLRVGHVELHSRRVRNRTGVDPDTALRHLEVGERERAGESGRERERAGESGRERERAGVRESRECQAPSTFNRDVLSPPPPSAGHR